MAGPCPRTTYWIAADRVSRPLVARTAVTRPAAPVWEVRRVLVQGCYRLSWGSLPVLVCSSPSPRHGHAWCERGRPAGSSHGRSTPAASYSRRLACAPRSAGMAPAPFGFQSAAPGSCLVLGRGAESILRPRHAALSAWQPGSVASPCNQVGCRRFLRSLTVAVQHVDGRRAHRQMSTDYARMLSALFDSLGMPTFMSRTRTSGGRET